MPLFGRFFSAADARSALRHSLIPLEMAPFPGHRLHATAGRSNILAMRADPNAMQQTISVFDTFAELCDRNRAAHHIPFRSRTDGTDGIAAPNLDTAARYVGIWSHFKYGSAIGIDAALLDALAMHDLADLAGQPGSERWEAVTLQAWVGGRWLIDEAKTFHELYRATIAAVRLFTKSADSPLLEWIRHPPKEINGVRRQTRDFASAVARFHE